MKLTPAQTAQIRALAIEQGHLVPHYYKPFAERGGMYQVDPCGIIFPALGGRQRARADADIVFFAKSEFAEIRAILARRGGHCSVRTEQARF